MVELYYFFETIFLWSRKKITMFVTGFVTKCFEQTLWVVICTRIPFDLMKGETWVSVRIL